MRIDRRDHAARRQKTKIATFSGANFATFNPAKYQNFRHIYARALAKISGHTADWLALQRDVSRLPERGRLLIEGFPHEGREHTCVYGFAGRNAQQALGLLQTKRLVELGLNPLGFVATDYATLIWGWMH